MTEFDSVLDRIYEAAALPHLWPDTLAEINRLAAIDAGALFVVPYAEVKWTATSNFRETVSAFVDEGRMPDNARNRRALARQHAGFVVDQDLFSEEELATEPLFAEFLRPRGWGWASGSTILLPTGEVLTFHFENRLDRGPVGREAVSLLDELRPHLARSALISCRLELERLNASLTGIEAIGYPAAVIGNGGRVIASNSSFDNLDSLVIATASGRFAIRNKSADDAIQQELDKLSRGYSNARSVAVPSDNEEAPVVFHLVPIRGRAHDLFVSAEAFLIATVASRPKAPPFEILNTLFDLTPAEARVARMLTSGLSAVEIAEAGKVSTDTIRGQIKSMLQKSGMHRQSDLIVFLAGISLRNAP